MKANIAHHIDDFEGIEFRDHKDYEYYKNLVKDWNGQVNRRIKIDAYVHAEYTSTEKICRGIGEFVIDNNLVLNFHMAETKLEI